MVVLANRSTIALVLIITSSGLVFGSGAFSAVSADRTASIGVAGDSNALLKITPYTGPNGNGEYADISEGTLEIANINVEASTTLPKIFTVTNQGTQTVAVWVVDFDNTDAAFADGVDNNNTEAITFYNATFGGSKSTENGVKSIEGKANAVALGVGETIVVSMEINTDGIAQNELDLLDQMIVHADATVDGAPGPGDYEEFETKNGKIRLCHKPGTPAEQTKTVPQSAVSGHLTHGDKLGACSIR